MVGFEYLSIKQRVVHFGTFLSGDIPIADCVLKLFQKNLIIFVAKVSEEAL